MNDQSLSRFEAQLERLIEGAFAQIFSKAISAHDLALHLARAMEADLEGGTDGDPRPFVPDQYHIRMNPDAQARLLKRQPALGALLGQHVVELATQSGYRLNSVPVIEIIADRNLDPGALLVHTAHLHRQRHTTAMMARIELPEQHTPQNPQIVVNGRDTIALSAPIITIGRSRDNDIVIDDPHASRHHVQLRLRFGSYTLFDMNSHAGVLVNDVPVREHRLQPGDVIRLGKTQLVYLEDMYPGGSQTGRHDTLS